MSRDGSRHIFCLWQELPLSLISFPFFLFWQSSFHPSHTTGTYIGDIDRTHARTLMLATTTRVFSFPQTEREREREGASFLRRSTTTTIYISHTHTHSFTRHTHYKPANECGGNNTQKPIGVRSSDLIRSDHPGKCEGGL